MVDYMRIERNKPVIETNLTLQFNIDLSQFRAVSEHFLKSSSIKNSFFLAIFGSKHNFDWDNPSFSKLLNFLKSHL